MDIQVKIPDIGIDQAEVIEILVRINDVVKKEQGLIIIEGDKTSMEIPSPYEGIIKDIKVGVSDIIHTGSVIMLIESQDNHMKDSQVVEDKTLHQKNCDNHVIYASPIIRRLARALNVNLNNIVGSGRKNRIIKQDIDDYINNLENNSRPVVQFSNSNNKSKKFDFTKFGIVEEVQLNKIKKQSGNFLFNNWSTIPHVTQFDEVDITDLEQFRIKYNQSLKNNTGSKFTLLSFITKAISKGLEKFPYFNSSIDVNSNTVFLKKYINIGIAVNTDSGLLVPVLKNVINKGLIDISHELVKISKKAREGKLSILDTQGGCFTISSLGGIGGGTAFTPIINDPEAAILGVSRARYKPIWNNKEFIPRLMLPLSLSYNHRIIDGVEGVKFISFINELLSDIRLLLL